MSIAKLLACLVLFCSLFPFANAGTLQSLIASYDYSFYNGTINVTSQNDYMIDKNANNKNDTLVINITTDSKTTGNYNFIVEIADENEILVNSTEKSVPPSDTYASINFPSELLIREKFNYSIRINDNDNNLVFRSSNIESRTYRNYETGINITKITDESANNNFIRLKLTVDSPKSATENITVGLAYNSSSISKTEEKTLGVGIQIVSIDFGNETIKSTHYKGNFTVKTIVIGNKIFELNKNTSIYDYEDFAKTSYIKSAADGMVDENSNNLSEFLEINFTVMAKNAADYKVNYELYDQFGNFVINGSKTENLATGTHVMQALINGSELYKTKIDGPYLLSLAKLSAGNETIDIVFNAHKTSQSFYTDYKKPNLPDLKVAVSVVFNSTSNAANLTVNLSNIGNSPAFNIFLDIFSNKTYNSNRSLAFLSNNDWAVYNLFVSNSSNDTLFTAIADFDSLVDESDEGNNMANSLEKIKNDFDADGIDDSSDTLIGSINSVNTTISNLTIRIGNLTDLSQSFNGTWKISFEDNISKIMEFDFNLSRTLNLTKIIIEKQKNSSFGYTLVHGVKLNGSTKAVYVDRTDSTKNGICIKDAIVTSISEITESCNMANEIKIECDGTMQSSYTCSYNSTTLKYKITGLNNSGLKQVDYAKPKSSGENRGSSEGGSGASGSSAAGSCLEKWECSEWSACINNLQNRLCLDKNGCSTIFQKPPETELCAISKKSSETSIAKLEENNKTNKKPQNIAKYSLPAITGFLLNPPKGINPDIGAMIILAIVTGGLFGHFYLVHKK